MGISTAIRKWYIAYHTHCRFFNTGRNVSSDQEDAEKNSNKMSEVIIFFEDVASPLRFTEIVFCM